MAGHHGWHDLYGVARGTSILYLLGTAAFVPGGLLLFPSLGEGHEREAIALYIGGSAALTVAALVDARPVLLRCCPSRTPSGNSRTLDAALCCLLSAGLCFLTASIALWPPFKPEGTAIGRWVFRSGNFWYIAASAASWRAAGSWRPPLGASLYALAEIVFFAGGLLLHEVGPHVEEGVACWVAAALLLVAGASVGVHGQFCGRAQPAADKGGGAPSTGA